MKGGEGQCVRGKRVAIRTRAEERGGSALRTMGEQTLEICFYSAT